VGRGLGEHVAAAVT